MGVGLLGCDHLVQVLAEVVQRPRVVVLAPARAGAPRPWSTSSGSRSSGSASTQRMIVRAWSTTTSPAASASRVSGVLLEVVAERHRAVRGRPGAAWSGGPASSPPTRRRRPGRRAGRRRARRPGPSPRRPAPRAGSARPASQRSRRRPWTTPTRPPRRRRRRASARSRPTLGVGVWPVLSWFNPSTGHRQSEAQNPCFVWHVDTFSKISRHQFRRWFRDCASLASSTTERRPASREAAATPSPPYPP